MLADSKALNDQAKIELVSSGLPTSCGEVIADVQAPGAPADPSVTAQQVVAESLLNLSQDTAEAIQAMGGGLVPDLISASVVPQLPSADLVFARKEILFSQILGVQPLNTQRGIEFLTNDSALESFELKRLFNLSAGVIEELTVGEHTRAVLEIFRHQIQFYTKVFSSHMPVSEPRKLLEFALIVHDLGKGLALEEFTQRTGYPASCPEDFKQASQRQLDFTLPVVENLMQSFEFNDAEKKFVLSLIQGDALGALVQGRVTLEVAEMALKDQANQAGLDLATFFGLKTIYYVSDAASYPNLRLGKCLSNKQPVFEELPSTQLLPYSEDFSALRKKLLFY